MSRGNGISRSNSGPHWKTPMCPPWICEQEKSHQESIREYGKCPQCWRGFTEEEIDDAYRAKGIDPKNGRKLKPAPVEPSKAAPVEGKKDGGGANYTCEHPSEHSCNCPRR